MGLSNKKEKSENLKFSSYEEEDVEFHDEEGEELWLISYADMMTLLMGFFALLLSFSTFDLDKAEKVKETASEHFGGDYEKPHENLQKKLEEVIKANQLTGAVSVKKHPLGAVISFTGNVLFDSGSIDFSNHSLQIIERVIQVINQHAKNYKLIIEGHTDDVPIKSGVIQSNWELSALRSSTLARAFIQSGFSKKNITVSGFADSKPLKPNLNQDGTPLSQNRAKNRRVVIKILRTEKKNLNMETGHEKAS